MSLLSPSLEAFLAITQAHTVHGAAKSLHLTQTAVTQRLRSLETRLRTTLFIRTRRGMQLTPEGEVLLRYCRTTQELAGQTLAQLLGNAFDHAIRITITGPTSIMRARIIPQCLLVKKKFPQLLFHFMISDGDNPLRKLRTGQCQLGIHRPDDIPAEMSFKLLVPEHYVLVGPTQWKKRLLSDILKKEKIIDFNPHDHITFDYLKHYRLFSHVQHERHFANRTDAIAQLIALGLGYGVLPLEFCQPWLKEKQLILLNHGKPYQHSLALAWYPRHTPPPYFSALLEVIQ